MPVLANQLSERLADVTIRDRVRLRRRLDRLGNREDRDAAHELERIARAIEAATAHRARRLEAVPTIGYPEELPVSARRVELLQAIADHQVVVVAGETGSGKTTQLPKMCLELGRGVDGMIGHTQPRRIAARTVAERLAEELAVPLGGAVGYAVRFTDTVGDSTLIKVMTDGILLAEIRRDRLLTAYDTIIVDEAHERSLNIDFLLGYLTRLLPERPDLKCIITSATIDTDRFAAHFSAPVVEVSGRTFPVDVRYRPIGFDDAGEIEVEVDPTQALCDAVSELVASGPGDVLVFLPGERDIRDAADALRTGGPPELEVLPLYARLSAAEQHRVFRPHRTRRVVLATNVAETSLTVPGIRFVVDTGLARISRFSHRTKVQRLPIEPISRASADQRAGRCGRVAPGTCIRLYSEEEYLARPAFTDPEILRTNLASVILQMAAIGLGDVEAFPFLDPPDHRSIADGRALLDELGAFDGDSGHRHLTPTGRRLAELPLDPRLARMVLEAERLDCLREVTVIAAALSVQDPRERPPDKTQLADEFHRRFAVPESDFLSFVRLWDYVAELQGELSGNQFRRRCRAEFLNALRIREWQDVASQIRRTYRSEGGHANRVPAHADQVHQALLTGLLSQVGMRDRVRGDYLGARTTRWQIGRGSVLERRAAPWVMAGALVETERTWARTVARIEPSWLERYGAHLLRRSYAEPYWHEKRGEAMTDERVTLFGLPVVTSRRTSLRRIDPGAARRLFIERALVERDWPVEIESLERNHSRVERIRSLEQRVRRANLYAGDEALVRFYDEKIPDDVTNGRRFERWLKRAAAIDAGVLDVPFTALLDPTARSIDLTAYPSRWTQGRSELPLRYTWEPGSADDGVTVTIPIAQLNQIRGDGFAWNVPGMREELVTALVRSLPKPIRRSLVPAVDTVRSVLETSDPADGPMFEVVADRLARLSGEPVTASLLAAAPLPDHLRMIFEVIDDSGRVIGHSRDLDGLRVELRDAMRTAIARADPGLERHGALTWAFGDLPRSISHGGAIGYPSLIDESTAVGVELLDTPEAQAEQMWRGTRRLLLIVAPLATVHLQRRLTNATKLAIAHSTTPIDALLNDCAVAVADEIILARGGPAYDAAGFEEMAGIAQRELADRVARLATVAAEVLGAATEIDERIAQLERDDRTGACRPALADVRRQVGALTSTNFVASTGTRRLGDVGRYLAAAIRRLDRLPVDVRRDGERQAVVDRVWIRYEEARGRLLGGSAPAVSTRTRLAEVRWMIEELRVSLWAQSLGTPAPVSETRILKAIRDSGS